jgi:hypothetical protein
LEADFGNQHGSGAMVLLGGMVPTDVCDERNHL